MPQRELHQNGCVCSVGMYWFSSDERAWEKSSIDAAGPFALAPRAVQPHLLADLGLAGLVSIVGVEEREGHQASGLVADAGGALAGGGWRVI
eukprot:1161163-Pelagomonas_calceolata.AAC.3